MLVRCLPRRRGALAAGLLLALAVGFLAAASEAAAQYSPSLRRNDRTGRTTLSRRTAGGGDFPTWEREVESDERSPMPHGRPGRYVPLWTLEFGAASPGIATAGGGMFVVPLIDGSIRLVDLEGMERGQFSAGGRILVAPSRVGSLVLVAAGERAVAVTESEVAWRSEAGARIVRPITGALDAAFVVREGGTIERLALEDGRLEWRSHAGGDILAGPAVSSRLILVGVSGDVVGLAPEDGRELFRLPMGDRVDSVLASETMMYAAGLGVSGRSRDVTPVMVGWPLRRRDGMPSGDPWRLRVGGTCPTAAIAFDAFVTFTCSDGYVRSIERRKGVGGWKTDLPSVATAPPVVHGSRLDYFIPQSRHAVALDAENGAVMAWATLPDEDETFVGTSSGAGGITASVTSFSRMVGWGWEWTAVEEEQEGDPLALRPGGPTGGIPIMR